MMGFIETIRTVCMQLYISEEKNNDKFKYDNTPYRSSGPDINRNHALRMCKSSTVPYHFKSSPFQLPTFCRLQNGCQMTQNYNVLNNAGQKIQVCSEQNIQFLAKCLAMLIFLNSQAENESFDHNQWSWKH